MVPGNEIEPSAPSPEAASIDLRQILAVGQRRWRLILAGCVLGLVPALSVPPVLQDEYEATAVVELRQPPEVMQMGPDYMPDSPGKRAGPNPETILAVARSNAVLERIPGEIEPGGSSGSNPIGQLKALLRSETMHVPGSDEYQSWRFSLLRDSLKFRLKGNSEVLEITASAYSGEHAAQLANATAQAFVEFRITERELALTQATDWLRGRVLELRSRIESSERALRELAANERIPVMALEPGGDEARAVHINQMEHLVAFETQLKAVRSRITQIRPQVETIVARRTAAATKKSEESESDGAEAGSALVEDPAVVRARYTQALLELEDSRLRYTSDHPDVRRLEQLVARLEARLAPAGLELTPGSEPLTTPSVGVINSDQTLGTATVATANLQVGDIVREYEGLLAQEGLLVARVQAYALSLQKSNAVAVSEEARATGERIMRELRVDREVLDLLIRRRNEATMVALTKVADARMLDWALASGDPVGPNRLVLFAGGIFAALGLGVGLAFVAEFLDPHLWRAEEIAGTLRAQFLAILPTVNGETVLEGQSAASKPTAASESYRILYGNLMLAAAHSRALTNGRSPEGASKLGSLLVTSGVAGEGKTTVCTNLAHSFAQGGHRTLLVDADVWRPRVHRILELEKSPGLSELVVGSATLDETIRRSSTGDFDVVTSGEFPNNMSQMLDPERIDRLLATMKQRYDVVLIDSPVLLSVADSLMLAAHADGALIVCRPGRLERSALSQIRSDLDRADAHVVGFVVNGVNRRDRYMYPRYLESPYLNPRPKAGGAESGPTIAKGHGPSPN